jgi:hypothetical protein
MIVTVKTNDIFNHFHLASGMTLSTIKDVIFNIAHLIYVGTCYKPNSSFDVFTVTHIPFRHGLKNDVVYYICNNTTNVTLNDAV